jgi:hypothetical protein
MYSNIHMTYLAVIAATRITWITSIATVICVGSSSEAEQKNEGGVENLHFDVWCSV